LASSSNSSDLSLSNNTNYFNENVSIFTRILSISRITFNRLFSDPKSVCISVCFIIMLKTSSPNVSYKATDVMLRRLHAKSVMIHSALLIEHIPIV